MTEEAPPKAPKPKAAPKPGSKKRGRPRAPSRQHETPPEPSARALKEAQSRTYDASSAEYADRALRREVARETGIGLNVARHAEDDALKWERIWREEGSVSGQVRIVGRRLTPPEGEQFSIPMGALQTWDGMLAWLRSPDPVPAGGHWDGRAIDWHFIARSPLVPSPHGKWSVHFDESLEQRAIFAAKQRDLQARLAASGGAADDPIARLTAALRGGAGGAGGIGQWGATATAADPIAQLLAALRPQQDPIAQLVAALRPHLGAQQDTDPIAQLVAALRGGNVAGGLTGGQLTAILGAVTKMGGGGGGQDKVLTALLPPLIEALTAKKEPEKPPQASYDPVNKLLTLPGFPIPIPLDLGGIGAKKDGGDLNDIIAADAKKAQFKAALGLEDKKDEKDLEVDVPGLGPVSIAKATAVHGLAKGVGNDLKDFAKELFAGAKSSDREEREEKKKERKEIEFAALEKAEREQKLAEAKVASREKFLAQEERLVTLAERRGRLEAAGVAVGDLSAVAAAAEAPASLVQATEEEAPFPELVDDDEEEPATRGNGAAHP